MKYDLNLSPCVNRYFVDIQNIVFFILLILVSIYIVIIRSNNKSIITANFFKPFSFINIREDKFLYFLFFYHIFFTLMRIFTAECKEMGDPFHIVPNDSFSLYYDANISLQNIASYTGSNFISYIISPFVRVLNVSFFNINLLFSLIGFFGIFKLYKVTTEYAYENKVSILLLLIFILLPNLHFWTSTLSKDVLIFYFAISCLSYAFSKKINKSSPWFILILFIIASMIRPYFGIILLISYIFAGFVVKNDFKISVKLLVQTSLLIYVFFKLSVNFFPGLFRFDILGQYDGDILLFFDNYFKYRLSTTNLGNSFDYTNTSYVSRFINYLFSPLHFTGNFKLSQLFAVFNNALLLIVFLYLSVNIALNYAYIQNALSSIFVKTNNKIEKLTLLIFLIVFTFVYSNTTANYGIIMRQKETFSFILYFYLIIIYSKIHYLKKND